MKETILIPIDNPEQLEPLLPILTAIARPASLVVVVLRRKHGTRYWMAGHWGFMRTGMEQMQAVFMDDYVNRAKSEEALVREKLARWRRDVNPKSLEVEVISCPGSIRPLIDAAKRNGRAGLIMTPAKNATPLRRFAKRLLGVGSLLRLPAKPPAVVLRPI